MSRKEKRGPVRREERCPLLLTGHLLWTRHRSLYNAFLNSYKPSQGWYTILLIIEMLRLRKIGSLILTQLVTDTVGI